MVIDGQSVVPHLGYGEVGISVRLKITSIRRATAYRKPPVISADPVCFDSFGDGTGLRLLASLVV